MAKRIIKVVFNDETTMEFTPIEVPIISPEASPVEKIKNEYKLIDQHLEFDKLLLNFIDNLTIENYAINNCDVISSDKKDATIYESDINDFSTEFILKEISERATNNKHSTNILSSTFIERFIKIFSKTSISEIENVLNQLETKHNIF